MSASAAKAMELAADSLRISLVTCYPGPEIFELYGHEAIRVQAPTDEEPYDMIFNYGLFDFSSPGFVSRFVKGETDYMAGSIPTQYFVDSYKDRGSRVVEHRLNLSPEEAAKLLKLLETDILPQNRTYRYKYFSNNCSTRLLDRIEAVTGPINFSPADNSSLTFRDLLKEYGSGYPWYQLGIEIALGESIDRPMTRHERMFNPMELASALPTAKRADGKPIILDTDELYKGIGDVRKAPTPWYLSPLFLFWVVAVAILLLNLKPSLLSRKIIASLWSLVMGLAGVVVWYLAFISVHEATWPNMLVIWMNPLWLISSATVWIRPLQRLNLLLWMLQGLGVIATAIIALTGNMHLNPALIPLLLISLDVAVTMIITGQKLRMKRSEMRG